MVISAFFDQFHAFLKKQSSYFSIAEMSIFPIGIKRGIWDICYGNILKHLIGVSLTFSIRMIYRTLLPNFIQLWETKLLTSIQVCLLLEVVLLRQMPQFPSYTIKIGEKKVIKIWGKSDKACTDYCRKPFASRPKHLCKNL